MGAFEQTSRANRKGGYLKNSFFIRALCKALHVANAKPPQIIRDQFYDIKDKVLKRFGQAEGFDYQRIDKKCWDCDGGVSVWNDDYCSRCDGSGIYLTTYVKLERWRLGWRVFHRPVDRYVDRDSYYDFEENDEGLVRRAPAWVRSIWDKETPINIEGLVVHKKYPEELSFEACYWFLLFFNSAAFWQHWQAGVWINIRPPIYLPIRLAFWSRRHLRHWRRDFRDWVKYTVPGFFRRRILHPLRRMRR